MANTVNFIKITPDYGVTEIRDGDGKLIGQPQIVTKTSLEAAVTSGNTQVALATSRLAILAA